VAVVVAPMLAASAAAVPSGPGWVFEDGFRALIKIDGERCRLMSRHGRLWTDTLPELAEIGRPIPAPAVLDGVTVVLGDDGRPSFERLSARLWGRMHPGPPATFVAFDLLELVGQSLIDRPRTERRNCSPRSIDGVRRCGDHGVRRRRGAVSRHGSTRSGGCRGHEAQRRLRVRAAEPGLAQGGSTALRAGSTSLVGGRRPGPGPAPSCWPRTATTWERPRGPCPPRTAPRSTASSLSVSACRTADGSGSRPAPRYGSSTPNGRCGGFSGKPSPENCAPRHADSRALHRRHRGR
jgi:ATP dependent DNA ligase domain